MLPAAYNCCCRFPGADPTGAGANELAPGMSAEVSVCFTPKTLGDYADAFAVETQLGRFEVALRGSRPHPKLSLPDELQVRCHHQPIGQGHNACGMLHTDRGRHVICCRSSSGTQRSFFFLH
jgi:hypothetical protein